MFLGMHIGIHDSNISLYKDGKSYYSKYERVSGIGGKKHGPGNFEWMIDTLKSWGVDDLISKLNIWFIVLPSMKKLNLQMTM
jgi:hypothetical protein